MRRISISLIVFLAAQASAQSLTVPAEVRGNPGEFITVPSTTDGKSVQWVTMDAGLNVFPVTLLRDSKTAVVTSTIKGRYRLLAYTALGDVPSPPVICVVVIGEAPPVPPGPGPDPVPPKPDPTPPAPIPVAGLRVLIVEETEDRPKLPANQTLILGSTVLRSWLNATCAKGPDGRSPEYRMLDKDVPMATEAKHWQDAMKRPRSQLPWIIISNGTTGFEGPLPATVDETLTLLKKFGGS